ncbi:nucleotidyltransferase domain protein [Methanobrevibacter cuticularis]|uniref:protein adenylyltransferase n=1 Tax=Methanobrevibacter cuticularis TaxID=47311 RepID=A0A166EDV3_9EURY|nr:nucleotidyltransferase domain-containing protein [Methanobrevibacter cuticularis]KZX16544.1 nucleotidyltransferase domain protein [Methanobrevibacter cuticularis]
MKDRMKLARDFANAIKSKYIKKIIVFGSVARGEDNEESDIDILIVSTSREKIEDTVYDKVFETIMNDEELISAHIISEERFKTKKHYSFLSNVIKEGVVIG